LSDSQTNEEIRDIFKDQGALELLLVTGFRRSLQSITINEKSTLITCLTDYHCLLKSKAEMDQFLMGLETLGIHQAIKDMPDTLKCFFVTDVDNMITAGK
jgi:phenylalanine-4-hydroxylase